MRKVTDQVVQEFIRNDYVQSTVGVNDSVAPKNSQFFKIKHRKYSKTACQEFRRYLSAPDCDQDCNPLDWWKVNFYSFPNLSRMARDYLAVPETEASVEREFSSGKRFITEERGSMSEDTIRTIQCLKSWLK